MGSRICWLAARGMPKAELLAECGLADTGEPDEYNETAFSATELPGGWALLWSNDQTFATAERCNALSLKAPIVSYWINETVMCSQTAYFEHGERRWMVAHNAQEGRFDLTTEGALPEDFAAIRERLMAEQKAEGGEDAEVDLIIEIPAQLAHSLCGFNQDERDPDEDGLEFTAAEPIGGAKPAGGLLSRLFGRG